MNTVEAKTLVRSIRGSAAQVLLAFVFARKAMDVAELITWTGLKRETIYQALNGLDGVIVKQMTGAHGREVWGPSSSLLPMFQLAIEAPEYQESTKRTSGPLFVDVVISEENSPTITTTTTTSQESTKRTPAEQQELEAALKDYGIIGKKRADLMAAEWVNARYVIAHCEAAKASGEWDQPIGMAIYQMLAQAPMPEEGFNGHPVKCNCAKCQVDRVMDGGRQKYLSSQYRDFVSGDDDE